jgi:hypothetical protein
MPQNDREEPKKGLSGPLAEHLARIEPKLQELGKNISDVPLLVLVLGGGDGALTYAKRCQIRDVLNGITGVQAVFPEDEAFSGPLRKRYRIPVNDPFALELVEGRVADLIIALEPADGVAQEVAMFSTYSDLAFKLYDLLPEEYKETADTSYPGLIRTRIRKDYYTTAQFTNCDVATNMVPEFVSAEQIRRYFRP